MANLNTSSISALNGTVVSGNMENFGTAGIIISGTWVGTLTIQGSLDDSTYVNTLWQSISTNVLNSTTSSNGQFLLNVSGLKSIQIKMTSYTSGTADITIQATNATVLSRSLSTIVGSSDGTQIGNVSDRLKVDASITGVGSNIVSSFNSKVRADVYTTPPIAISSNVTYTTLYTYSGTGFLMGFNIEFNGVNVVLRLQVDGETILDGNDLSTLNGFLVTADAQYRRQIGSGIVTQSSSFDWSLKHPISFASNVTISARLSGGAAKNYQQGIVYISKVT